MMTPLPCLIEESYQVSESIIEKAQVILEYYKLDLV